MFLLTRFHRLTLPFSKELFSRLLSSSRISTRTKGLQTRRTNMMNSPLWANMNLIPLNEETQRSDGQASIGFVSQVASSSNFWLASFRRSSSPSFGQWARCAKCPSVGLASNRSLQPVGSFRTRNQSARRSWLRFANRPFCPFCFAKCAISSPRCPDLSISLLLTRQK